MSKELRLIDAPAQTVSANVIAVADATTHSVSLSELTSGYYVGDFPSVPAGTYDVAYLLGGNAIAAQTIVWDGIEAVNVSQTLQDTLAAIDTRLNTIGSGRVTVVAPVADPTRIELIAGDDYLFIDGRQIAFSFSGAPDLTDATVVLKATPHCHHCRDTSFTLSRLTNSAASAAFELSAAQTNALDRGDYAYDFAVVATLSDASVVTLADGSIEVYDAIDDEE